MAFQEKKVMAAATALATPSTIRFLIFSVLTLRRKGGGE